MALLANASHPMQFPSSGGLPSTNQPNIFQGHLAHSHELAPWEEPPTMLQKLQPVANRKLIRRIKQTAAPHADVSWQERENDVNAAVTLVQTAIDMVKNGGEKLLVVNTPKEYSLTAPAPTMFAPNSATWTQFVSTFKPIIDSGAGGFRVEEAENKNKAFELLKATARSLPNYNQYQNAIENGSLIGIDVLKERVRTDLREHLGRTGPGTKSVHYDYDNKHLQIFVSVPTFTNGKPNLSQPLAQCVPTAAAYAAGRLVDEIAEINPDYWTPTLLQRPHVDQASNDRLFRCHTPEPTTAVTMAILGPLDPFHAVLQTDKSNDVGTLIRAVIEIPSDDPLRCAQSLQLDDTFTNIKAQEEGRALGASLQLLRTMAAYTDRNMNKIWTDISRDQKKQYGSTYSSQALVCKNQMNTQFEAGESCVISTAVVDCAV